MSVLRSEEESAGIGERACVYESNCDEHTDCNEGMAEFMAGIEQEDD